MRYSTWVVSSLVVLSQAAPAIPQPEGINSVNQPIVNRYFDLLATKAQQARDASEAPAACDLSLAKMPVAPDPTGLSAPAEGLTLAHVAIGRGTQNYSCATSDATTVPAALGAVANLYNASCIAALYPDMLATLPPLTLQWDLPATSSAPLYPASLPLSGHHYFSSLTTPTFDLNTPGQEIGFLDVSKDAATPAPADAAKGQGSTGNGAVPWLRLLAKAGATGGLAEVYRLNTAGGAAPANCAGMPATFEVQYAAEYWFYKN